MTSSLTVCKPVGVIGREGAFAVIFSAVAGACCKVLLLDMFLEEESTDAKAGARTRGEGTEEEP